VKNKLEKAEMEYKIKIYNLQGLIDNQLDKHSDRNRILLGYNYDEYHTYDEVCNCLFLCINLCNWLSRKMPDRIASVSNR